VNLHGGEDLNLRPTYVLWQRVVISNVMAKHALLQSTVYTEDGNSNFLRNFGNYLVTTKCSNLEDRQSKAESFLF